MNTNIGNAERILLFDGVCNLCNSTVQFIIRHDKNKKFKFGSLQSDAAKEIIRRLNIQDEYLNTFVYLRDDKYYLRSTAVLYVLRDMGGVWKLFYGLKIIPAFIRNVFYNLVAKTRYRFFGKRTTCMVPDPELNDRFI